MLEIFIDNKKIKYRKYKNSTFSSLIVNLTKKIEKENRYVDIIYLNGKYINENKIINIHDNNVVEIFTKSFSDYSVEIVIRAKNNLDIFFEKINLINNESIIDLDEIYYFLEFIYWLYDFIKIVRRNYIFEYDCDDIDRDLEKLEEIYNHLDELCTNEDYGEFFETLFNFSDYFKKYYNDIESYLQMMKTKSKVNYIIN